MPDANSAIENLRESLAGSGDERLGKALSDLLENPLLTGAVGRAFDAREKVAQVQELAMGALNIPSAADIERLTRRLRTLSHRLEAVEDSVHNLDRALAFGGLQERLSAIEQQLGTLIEMLAESSQPSGGRRTPEKAASGRVAGGSAQEGATRQTRSRKPKAAKAPRPGQPAAARTKRTPAGNPPDS